jgi:hypothetical protein
MPKAGFIVARVSILVLAASTLGAAMLAAPAAAQPVTCSSTTKCFFAVNPVMPSNPAAGTNTSFTFTIQNEASPQQLGAVQISAPIGFMITGASLASGASGTTSFTSSSAQFLNLNLASGAITTLTVSATVPCGSGSYQWGIAAKQSNNFNGSGNDFQLDPNSTGNLSGTLTGSCTVAPPCPSNTACSASASSATTSVTVTTSSAVPGDSIVTGIEGASFNYSCPTYTSSADVVGFAVYNANGLPQSIPLTVTVRIDKSVVSMSGHPGASSWQICYASTTPFNANAVPGTYTPASDPAAAMIGGVPYNTGLPLGCSTTQGTLPCVQSQNKNMAGDVIVTFLAFGDPFGHP